MATSPRWVLRRLGELQVVHLLGEGGAEDLTEIIELDLWDELRIFMAPELAGPGAFAGFRAQCKANARRAGLQGLRGLLGFVVPDASLIIERGVRGPV